MAVELQVKKTKTENVFDKGIVSHMHILEMIGKSADGELDVKLVFKSFDPAAIEEVIPMIEGLQKKLVLEDVNHELDEFVQEEITSASADKAAHEARLEAAKAQG
jgi:hypothetical protein